MFAHTQVLTLRMEIFMSLNGACRYLLWFLECTFSAKYNNITLPPSVNQLSRQWGILDISQACRPPRPVKIVFLLTLLLYCALQFAFAADLSVSCTETQGSRVHFMQMLLIEHFLHGKETLAGHDSMWCGGSWPTFESDAPSPSCGLNGEVSKRARSCFSPEVEAVHYSHKSVIFYHTA
jgi:hypothetical protein